MMNIVFTGPAVVANTHFERKHLIALAHEKGHTVQASVRYDTNLLVMNPETAKKKTVKLRDAKHYGVKVTTPEEFLKLMDFL
jgi:NAD-dependent DNA ligase